MSMFELVKISREEKGLRGLFFCMCVGFVPVLEQFFTLTVVAPLRTVDKKKNLSLYIFYLAWVVLIIPCISGFAVVRVPLHGENMLGHTGWGSWYCWHCCSLGNRNVLVCEWLDIHRLWQGRWLCVRIYCLSFGAVAVSVVSKTSSMDAGVLFSSAAPRAGASSTHWLTQPFLFGQLCHSCVCSRARALLKLTETESITMTSSVFFMLPNINLCLHAGCMKYRLKIT